MGEAGFSEGRFRSADGLSLYYRDYDNGSSRLPLVCLPGLTRNSRDFEAMAATAAQSRRVICPDFRGRGESDYDPDWKNYHPAQYTADTWALLDQLGIDQVVAAGTSLGGWMAMLMAYERPGSVAAAIMNDIGPDVNPDGIARVQKGAGRLDKVATLDEAVEQAKWFYEIAFPDWSDEKWRHYTQITYRKTDDGHYDLNFDRNIGVASREGVSGLRTDPWTLFDSLIDKPVLLVHGSISDILTPDIIERMRAKKPDLEVVDVSRVGHAPLLDEPEAQDAISTFLDNL